MDNRYIKKMLPRFTITFFVVFGFASLVSGAEYSLFLGDSNITLQSAPGNRLLPGSLPPAKQWRSTMLNPVIAIPNILSKGDVLALSLFNGTFYNAHIDRVSTNIDGTITVRGRIDGFPLGYVIISTSGNRSLGSINIPEKNEYYIIQSDSDDMTHYLLDVNPDQLAELEDGPALIPPAVTSQQSAAMNMLANTLAGNPLDQVTIDVMIVYTPAARVWANTNGGGIANVVAQAVAKGQLAMSNSNTYVTLNLAYSGEINYTESGDTNTDLLRLTYTADNYMDEVHTLRNQYSADVVALFTKIDDTGGLSWILNSAQGYAEYAFSICRVQQASTSSFTYVHEMGHNMGCGHHKEQTSEPGPGLYSYSAGWRWVGNDSGRYCSVMTYEEGAYFSDGLKHTRVGYFSNPSVLYKDVATGNSLDGDNARTIREIKFVIAAYRNNSSSTYTDIGLRYYDGTQTVNIACEQGTLTSPLRICKNGVTYGIVLVEPDDPYASGIIIQTSSGPKAMRKLQ